MHPQTLSVHAGYEPDPATGAISPNLVLSTTFEREKDGSFVEGRDIYTRSSNPNRRSLEARLAALEGGSDAIAFASGQAATMGVFHTLGANAHVIIPDDIYYGTRLLLETVYANWGLIHTAVDMTNLNAIEAAILPNTKLIWIESPSNPLLKISDIESIATLARQKNILTACDNTWASPYFQQPLTFGVDVVMHSTTKYLGGHSDLLGGCIVLKNQPELLQKIRSFQTLGGAVPSPFDCWLLLRSISTFAVRMPVHAANAWAVAQYLEQHPAIEQVFYPALKSHPQHLIAQKQMQGGFGGMLSVLLKGNDTDALRFCSGLQIFRHATSLGGVESLVEHRHSVEGVHSKSPKNLVRLSIGIEHIDDLIADLAQALSSIK